MQVAVLSIMPIIIISCALNISFKKKGEFRLLESITLSTTLATIFYAPRVIYTYIRILMTNTTSGTIRQDYWSLYVEISEDKQNT